MSTVLSMAAFALASSISPGPVNLVALGSGARHGLRASLAHVTGATLGFDLLLILTGLGLHEVLRQWPILTFAIRLMGVLYLLYLAWKLASDPGQLNPGRKLKIPTALGGACMQWLNPKAWLACVAGMGAFVADGDITMVWVFAGVYLVVCWLSIAAWAGAGSLLRTRLSHAPGVRWFNRAMALLLAGCAMLLLVE